jgi:hypothetical protein
MNIEESQYPQSTPTPKSHSILGIISLAIALLVGLFFCLAFVVQSAWSSSFDPAALQDPNEFDRWLNEGGPLWLLTWGILFDVCAFGAPFLPLAGLGLGIGGLFEKNKQKVFPILGTMLNGLFVLGSCALLIGWLVITSSMGP